MNIVVFTPTYNEVDNIEIFIRQLFNVLPEAKLLVVDDNSPDGTSQKVEQLKKEFKNLYLITRTTNRGRGYAGIEGFKKALDLGADIIVEMDADLSHLPSELPKLIKVINEHPEIDIVVGSRYCEGGKDSERNIIRKLISLFARIYIRIITGIQLRDPTSGFKLYRRKVIEKILPYLTASDPFIVTETNYICKMFGFNFYEVPIEFHKRLYGKSKLSVVKLVKYLFKVWQLIFRFFLIDRYNRLFVKTTTVLTLARLLIAGSFGLTDDESHYWQYSQHLDFSYYDHPPMVGYLIFISTKILGNNLYGVRLPAIICFLIALVYFYKLVKELYNTQIAFYSCLVLNFIPVVFTGSVVTIPDSPLVMFWIMYMFYFYKFMLAKDTWLLYLCSIILGFALLSKYTAIFLFVSTLILFFVKKDLTQWLIKKDFYMFCLLILVISLPVFLWNITHNFVSFKYQFFHSVGKTNVLSLQKFIENFVFQSIYISPIVFILLWYTILAFVVSYKRQDFNNKFLFYFSLPGIIIVTLLSFRNKLLPHWPVVLYIVIIPLMLALSEKKLVYYISLFSAMICTIFLVSVVLFGIIPIPSRCKDADTPDKLYGWEVAAKELYNLIRKHNTEFVFVHKYYTAGQLRFALAKFYNKTEKIPQIYCLDQDFNQYDFWNKDLSLYHGKDAIYIIDERFYDSNILNQLPFKKVELVAVVSYKKFKNWPQRKFKFYLCKNFDYHTAEQKFIQKKYNVDMSVVSYFRNYDKQIFLAINQQDILYRNKIFTTVWYILTNLGNGIVLVPATVLILFFVDKKNFVKNSILFLIIAAVGGLLIQFLKQWFDKPRPLKLFFDILHQPINVIGEQLRELGFPSGHTFLAFSTATFLSEKIKKWWFITIAYFLATLVGISRVMVGAHFLSDVIGGLIIGILFTNLCIKISKELS